MVISLDMKHGEIRYMKNLLKQMMLVGFQMAIPSYLSYLAFKAYLSLMTIGGIGDAFGTTLIAALTWIVAYVCILIAFEKAED